MADTTGPMPLIRWRGEGKRRLGLAFTSPLEVRGSPFAPDSHKCLASRVEHRVCDWAQGPHSGATLRGHTQGPHWGAKLGATLGTGTATWAEPRWKRMLEAAIPLGMLEPQISCPAHVLSVLTIPAAWRLAISPS